LDIEKFTDDYLMTINKWNGTLSDLKQTLLQKLEEAAKKTYVDLNSAENVEYYKNFCDKFNSTLWTCDECIKWDFEEWKKLRN
jgi:hypothetical protein